MSDKETTQLHLATDTLVGLGKQTVQIITKTDENGLDRPFAVVPQGHTINALDKFLPPLEEAAQTFAKPEAFISYVERFKRPETVVFNSLKSGVISAIFDYHANGKGGAQKHTARYSPERSTEFTAWKRIIDGGFINQTAFAEFLDEYGHTVTTPSEAEIKDIVENINATMDAEAKSVQRTRDGSGGFSYQVKMTLKGGSSGELDLPTEIVLSLPIYTGGQSVDIRLKVQIRVGGEGIRFRFIAPKLEDLIREYNAKAVETVAQMIGTTIYAQP